jgi:magnesium-transporting ATPase (P-type)
MIMDTLAALALATEIPNHSIIRTPPLKKGENILTSVLWRQIYGVVLYQLVVMTICLLFGQFMWDVKYDVENIKSVGTEKFSCLLFNTFIFMQLFNYLNCRIPNPKSINIFKHFFSNLYFIAIFLISCTVQVLFCQWGGSAFSVSPLTVTEHASCMMWGAGTVVVSTVLKLTPAHWAEKIPMKIRVDENQEIDPNDRIMAAYNKQANAKVTNKKEVEPL